MRKLIFFAVLAAASCFTIALAQEVRKGFKRYDIGTGVKIDLPKKWVFQTYPMPLAGATNIKITSGYLQMQITGFPLPKNLAARPAQDNSGETLNMVMEPYIPYSKEGRVEPAVIANGSLHGAYGTLSSASGEPAFPIFSDKMYSCVTTAVIRTPDTAFSISIGSESCTSKEHQAALLALTGMQIGG